MATNLKVKTGADDRDVFVARQPIVDRRGRAIAYELLFRDSSSGSARIGDDFLCTSAVVERTVGSIGIERLLDGKDAFLNCSSDFLYSDFVDVLPAKRFVLEVLESCELTPRLADRCIALGQAGFRIALDDVREITPEIREVLPVVDIVKLDWPFIDINGIGEIVAEIKSTGKMVLAEKIEHRSERDFALELGCDLLQGYYFATPQIMSARKSMPPIAAVLKVFDLITHEAPQARIARALNDMPLLVAQLLRLANSSGQPRAQAAKVSSVSQALAMAGSRRLLQWCCLLLYANPDGLPVDEDPLALLAERRAMFMGKAVSGFSEANRSMEDSAFLTGMLSLLPLACGMNERLFFDELAVSDEIKMAILDRKGMLGQLLLASEQVERGEPQNARNIISSQGFSGDSLREMPGYY
jgi:c-di-GMP-related signal transduction protein